MLGLSLESHETFTAHCDISENCMKKNLRALCSLLTTDLVAIMEITELEKFGTRKDHRASLLQMRKLRSRRYQRLAQCHIDRVNVGLRLGFGAPIFLLGILFHTFLSIF